MSALLVSGALLLALLAFSARLGRDSERVLLCLLAQDGRPMRGLELVQAGASARGVVYVVLSSLEDEGYVRSRSTMRATDDKPVPAYELTGAGRAVAHDLRRERRS